MVQDESWIRSISLTYIDNSSYVGMPQNSSFEWKSESQLKFLEEPCTSVTLKQNDSFEQIITIMKPGTKSSSESKTLEQ